MAPDLDTLGPRIMNIMMFNSRNHLHPHSMKSSSSTSTFYCTSEKIIIQHNRRASKKASPFGPQWIRLVTMNHIYNSHNFSDKANKEENVQMKDETMVHNGKVSIDWKMPLTKTTYNSCNFFDKINNKKRDYKLRCMSSQS